MTLLSVFAFSLVLTDSLRAQDRETKVRNDRKNVEEEGRWIYNDLPKGIAEAKKTGKPLLVIFRCIPCEACAQLDSQVVAKDSAVQRLLDEFVRVRIIQANAMDLSLFQFDYDQSMAAFFLNAEMTIYGRFGTRSDQTESDADVSVEGFGAALEGSLALHKGYPANKSLFAAKRGPAVAIKVPEEFPNLKGKYSSKLNYEGKVVQSCIHCHQVGESIRLVSRQPGKSMAEEVLYPYPHPKILGLILDPKERARVSEVTADSQAEKDGFQAGDDILSLAGQPLLSIGDIQWVLHNAGKTERLTAEVQRDGKKIKLPVTLAAGWRQKGDISWRATSWDLRRMTTGGLLLDSLTDEERKSAKLEENVLALRIKHAGEYNDHAAAKNAGFRKGDIIVELDGSSAPLTESELMVAMMNGKRPGDKVPAVVLREGKRMELKLPIQ
ncbi:MAG: PDZ domain-containing protein [Pirellulaceae bacterium]|nr:PDZ domain-containing protein [Pirellulaceae bacterium]